jgi:hypothetical protein
VSGRRRRGELRIARHFPRVLRGRDVGRHTLFEHQATIEPRRLAVGQQVGGEVELGVAIGEHRRRQPGEIQAGQLDAILDVDAHIARQRCRHIDRLHPLAGVDLAEIPVDEPERLAGIDVAGQCD